MIKRIFLILLTIFLFGCQSRFGTIEILDSLKVSDISGIYVKLNDDCLLSGYLTENDETEIINTLKDIKTQDLKIISSKEKRFDCCLIIETENSQYEILVINPNIISIDRKLYKIDEKRINKIFEVIDNISYIKA